MAAIGLVLIGLAYLGLLGLVVVLATNSATFNAVAVVGFLILHAAGAAAGIVGGVEIWRRRAKDTPIAAAIVVVFVSLLTAWLIPQNSFLYSVLGAAAAFCAVAAWRGPPEQSDDLPDMDLD